MCINTLSIFIIDTCLSWHHFNTLQSKWPVSEQTNPQFAKSVVKTELEYLAPGFGGAGISETDLMKPGRLKSDPRRRTKVQQGQSADSHSSGSEETFW